MKVCSPLFPIHFSFPIVEATPKPTKMYLEKYKLFSLKIMLNLIDSHPHPPELLIIRKYDYPTALNRLARTIQRPCLLWRPQKRPSRSKSLVFSSDSKYTNIVIQSFKKLPYRFGMCHWYSICRKRFEFLLSIIVLGRNDHIWTSPYGCLMFSFKTTFGKATDLCFMQYLVSIALIRAIKSFPDYHVCSLSLYAINSVWMWVLNGPMIFIWMEKQRLVELSVSLFIPITSLISFLVYPNMIFSWVRSGNQCE